MTKVKIKINSLYSVPSWSKDMFYSNVYWDAMCPDNRIPSPIPHWG